MTYPALPIVREMVLKGQFAAIKSYSKRQSSKQLLNLPFYDTKKRKKAETKAKAIKP